MYDAVQAVRDPQNAVNEGSGHVRPLYFFTSILVHLARLPPILADRRPGRPEQAAHQLEPQQHQDCTQTTSIR